MTGNFQGTISPGALPGLLRDLYVSRRSGLLHFSRAEEQRSVRFRRGHIANASSSVVEDRLGGVLVRLGVLSQADLDRCSEVIRRDKKRLGDVLQELGVMTRDKVEESLVLHVREILLQVFSLSDGYYAFEEQEPEGLNEDDVSQRLSTGEMILEAVRRVKDPDVVRYALGDLGRVLVLSNDPLLRFQKITLSPADGFLLSRVDGTMSAHEVLELLPVAPEDGQRSLFGLLCTGVVEYADAPAKTRSRQPDLGQTGRFVRTPEPAPQAAPPPTPTPAPPPAAPLEDAAAKTQARRREIEEMHDGLKTKTHFDVLGVPRGSTDAQIKEAYVKLAKRFHPDTEHDPGLRDMAGRIEAVFIRIGEAYDVLRNPRTRASYEERLGPKPMPFSPPPAAGGAATTTTEAGTAPPPSAGKVEVTPQQVAAALKVAEKLLAQEKYWDVIQGLEPYLAEATGKLKVRVQVALAKAYVKNPKWVKRAEEELLHAVQADPSNLEASAMLGGIYKSSGLKARATSMYRKVLELDPGNEAASAALAELGYAPEAVEPPKESGGFLKRLFKKD